MWWPEMRGRDRTPRGGTPRRPNAGETERRGDGTPGDRTPGDRTPSETGRQARRNAKQTVGRGDMNAKYGDTVDSSRWYMESQVDIFHIEIFRREFCHPEFLATPHYNISDWLIYMKHIAVLQIVIYALYCKVLYRICLALTTGGNFSVHSQYIPEKWAPAPEIFYTVLYNTVHKSVTSDAY